MSEARTFKKKEGQWVKTENPTKEQLLSMSEQQARMFTPDGQLRMVIEIRENASRGRLKPMSLRR
ncbi:MAG: hypothetical protein B9S38_05070 [Verrucomicrobiia bacterium Tous-C4TDCM]|jgi:hypothetical protein|nr:MAG: hypothetical protein B9S38_05070 [Verrucomicrobiae bacterium Tous-C4TDCM]